MLIRDLCRATNRPIPVETEEIRESFLQAADFVGRDEEFNQLLDALTDEQWMVKAVSG